jgi:hypothetical protein
LVLWEENTGVPHDTTGLHPLKKWSYHGVRFSVVLHVMVEDTFQNK